MALCGFGVICSSPGLACGGGPVGWLAGFRVCFMVVGFWLEVLFEVLDFSDFCGLVGCAFR